MPERLVFSKTVTITASAQYDFDPIDVSQADVLRMEAILTGNAGAGASDKLDLYLQSRREANKWNDRAHLDQFLGTDTAGTLYEANVQKFGPLSTAEAEGKPSGSTGGSRLAVSTVLQGAFPGRYRNPGVGTQNSFRIDAQITNGSAPSFPVIIRVYADAP